MHDKTALNGHSKVIIVLLNLQEDRVSDCDRCRVLEGYHENKRCWRDTYQEAYITKHASTRKQKKISRVSAPGAIGTRPSVVDFGSARNSKLVTESTHIENRDGFHAYPKCDAVLYMNYIWVSASPFKCRSRGQGSIQLDEVWVDLTEQGGVDNAGCERREHSRTHPFIV